jgi:hypothetical protein
MPADTFPARTPQIPRDALARLHPERLAVSHQLARAGVAAALSLLTLASLWLRTRGLHVHYWIDEGLSVAIAQHPLSEIPHLMRQDGSPPLYYLLLHVWIGLRGSYEVATHELSLVFALLVIPAAYWAGSSLFSRRTGLLCAALAAGAPYLTTYGQETRMYALLALLSVIVAASFVHVFVRRRRRYLPVFVASLTAALYTHNWALFLGLMTAVAFLLCVRESPDDRRSLWRDGAIGFGAVAVLYAPWLPTLLFQVRHTGAPWDVAPVVWSLTQGLYSLVGGRGAAVALLFGAGAALLALRSAEDARTGILLAAKSLLLLGVGTLLVAWIGSKITPAWAIRYLAVIVGPLILLFGLGLARAGRLGLVALALVACFWILDPVPSSLYTKSNVASAVAKVRPDLGPGGLVLSTQPEQVPNLAYYLPHRFRYGTPLGAVSDPGVFDWRDALSRFRRSSVRSVLMPTIGSLAPGQRLVLVVPLRLPHSPLWMQLINRTSTRWSNAVGHDRSFRLLAASSANWNASGLPVRVMVFVRRGATATAGLGSL